ncbi:DUF4491 family protein [Scatolibacter rhodanostii]|uniref:DUF4491 family protein n=1 Tax=Scatolibacter rhodanostii TaxID=2014781 RepID=UPI000C0827E2|nr:DUF4491 family protein [Scatolibacter rhodanostii]
MYGLLIGLFHPIVIKAEFYFSKRIYPLFIVAGIVCLLIAFFTENQFISSLLGVTGFSCFWSVKELFEQEKRVQKGWFPKNSNRE